MVIREFTEAENDIKKVLELDPNIPNKILYFHLLVLKKQYEDAIEYLTKLKSEYPDANFNFEQALIFAIKGNKEKVFATYKSDKFEDSWYYKMGLLSLLDQKDKAINEIQDRYEYLQKTKQSYYLNLKYTSWFKNLRSDPRFQEIVAKHKKLYEENLEKYGDMEL
jgi:tetratricopeptide (TPR) repeat protein